MLAGLWGQRPLHLDQHLRLQQNLNQPLKPNRSQKPPAMLQVALPMPQQLHSSKLRQHWARPCNGGGR